MLSQKIFLMLLTTTLLTVLLGCMKIDQTNIKGNCVLMKDKETQKLNCFGCAGAVCKDPSYGWELIEDKQYKCISTSHGCELG